MFIFVDLMGKILLKNIPIYAYHGCMIEEEKIGSDYIVNLTVNADLSLSFSNGQIGRYCRLCFSSCDSKETNVYKIKAFRERRRSYY